MVLFFTAKQQTLKADDHIDYTESWLPTTFQTVLRYGGRQSDMRVLEVNVVHVI